MPPASASAAVASSAAPAVDEDAWQPAVSAAPQTVYVPTEPVGLTCVCMCVCGGGWVGVCIHIWTVVEFRVKLS